MFIELEGSCKGLGAGQCEGGGNQAFLEKAVDMEFSLFFGRFFAMQSRRNRRKS